MLPIPKHLQGIFITEGENNSEFQVSGIIRCACGCENFRIRVFADTDNNDVRIQEYEDDYALMIKANCKDCGKEYLIYDYSRHGWNGFVCGDGISVPDEKLSGWGCSKCGCDNHGMSALIRSQGKEDFIVEAGIQDGDDTFNADDWTEAFDSIEIRLKCPACGYEDNDWFECETM